MKIPKLKVITNNDILKINKEFSIKILTIIINNRSKFRNFVYVPKFKPLETFNRSCLTIRTLAKASSHFCATRVCIFIGRARL